MPRQWAVKELRPNVHRLKFFDIADGWDHYMLITADRHHDHPCSDRQLEKDHLERARELDAPILDIGDLFDVMQSRNDPRRSKADLDEEFGGVEAYFDAVVDQAERFYKPYADLFAVLGRGNHETKILKHNETDLTARLARRLRHAGGEPWPRSGAYGGYVKLVFEMQKTSRRTLNVKYFHGAGGAAPVTKGVINTNRNAVKYPDADIVITGHIHEAWAVFISQETLTPRGNQGRRNQLHISVPTYKDEYGDGAGGFLVEKGVGPKPVGCVWLRFKYHRGRIAIKPDLDVY